MSRKKSLRKDYGYKISSGILKSRRALILRMNGFSVFGRTGRKKSHSSAKKSQVSGVALSNSKLQLLARVLNSKKVQVSFCNRNSKGPYFG
jgi:hypothetical protein